MMTVNEAYAILELKYGEPPEAIAAAFNKLIRVWHPDRFAHAPDLRDDATKKSAQINAARDVLAKAWASGSLVDGEQSAQQSCEPLIDENVLYLGADPRLPEKTSSWTWDGAPAVVWLNSEMLKLGLVTGGKLVISQSYPIASLIRISTDNCFWTERGRETYGDTLVTAAVDASLRFTDPAGIVPHFLILLRFRNNYHRELFVRTALSFSGFKTEKYQPPTAPARPLKNPPDDNSNWAIGATIVTFVLMFFIFPLAVTISLNDNRNSLNDNGKSGSGDIPAYAQVSGSFSVWAEPKPRGSRVELHIRVRVSVPPSINRSRELEVTGEVNGSDGYKRIFRSSIAAWEQIADDQLEMSIDVPGGAPGVTNRLTISSQQLNEHHVFVLQ